MSGSRDQLSRRKFLAGASLLLGSVGVAPLIKRDLLKKLGGEILPTARAAEPSVDFMIEICGRAGSPVIFLGAGQEFTQNGGNNYPNIPMQQVSDLVMRGGTDGARAIYMNNVAGGANSVAALLGPHASNIAISQGFNANGLGHTALFAQREGSKGMGLTTPIIGLADRAKKSRAYDSLVVHGVNWFRNQVTNQTNGMQELVDVNSINAFTNLFKEPVLRMTKQEVQAVSDAARQLSAAQARALENRIQNVANVAQAQDKGAQLLTVDYSSLLNVNGMNTNFMVGQPFNQGGSNWGDIGGALAYTCKALEHGLISSATITYDSNDWHGRQDVSNTSYQANAGIYLARILSATVTFLKATPHPFRAGESLWDRTLIQMSSEFTRGISVSNSDNNDGGTAGMVLIGGKVKGGYYGVCDLTQGAGRAYGFDPVSGNPTVGTRVEVGSLYNTVNALLGNSEKVPGEPVLNCLIRS